MILHQLRCAFSLFLGCVATLARGGRSPDPGIVQGGTSSGGAVELAAGSGRDGREGRALVGVVCWLLKCAWRGDVRLMLVGTDEGEPDHSMRESRSGERIRLESEV